MKFGILCMCIVLVCGEEIISKSGDEIKKYSMFLDKTTKGKAEKPLTPELKHLQNEWERSGAFEGDIILTKDQKKALIDEYSGIKNSVINANSIWPNKTLYYHIDENYDIDHVNEIKKAFKILQKESCIKIVPKTSKTKNYIEIKGRETGCKTNVGFLGTGPQILNLYPNKVGSGCFKLGVIIHELLHSLGFFHMHSTFDRDDYVRIKWDKIKPGEEFNFFKYSTSQLSNQGVKYDYGSILHYSEYSFSIDGNKTIIPSQVTNVTIGQRESLSAGDIIKLNKLYKCPGF